MTYFFFRSHDYSFYQFQVKSIRNFFLVQLRLLKCEDSKFKPVYDVESCRFSLENAITKKFIPEEDGNMFKIFLDNNKV